MVKEVVACTYGCADGIIWRCGDGIIQWCGGVVCPVHSTWSPPDALTSVSLGHSYTYVER